MSEQSKCAPQFVHIMWHACIETIVLSQRGHLIGSFNKHSNAFAFLKDLGNICQVVRICNNCQLLF
ncbi:protein of unknown function [Candidatus Nitrosotalea okcheonensis]|uniref:Uncharacterized protein n=1 Tax=Candidatus Nitrosotalea okcheonensis TaxID=1903276 RepID=A0A2H1FHD7_9ARCH|nr:protein of unknown function [Candidatus Nitrosotalea okcheonensis]